MNFLNGNVVHLGDLFGSKSVIDSQNNGLAFSIRGFSGIILNDFGFGNTVSPRYQQLVVRVFRVCVLSESCRVSCQDRGESVLDI